jgi:tetratricopeptide (TPR) repeat protein
MPRQAGSCSIAFVLLLVSALDMARAEDVTIDSANELYKAGKYAEALAAYKHVLKGKPDDQVARYMAAQSAYLVGEYQEALALWLAVEKAIGDSDLLLKEKLIQTYEKLDDLEEVQRRLNRLLQLRAETEDEAYKRKRSFCRDQFRVGDERFLAHHHFDFPDGDDTCFTIYCLGANNRPKYWFKFWCFASTNQIARELGELKDGERLHHIDEYRDRSQINHLHTKKQLSYREFKKFVVAELTKRLKDRQAQEASGHND